MSLTVAITRIYPRCPLSSPAIRAIFNCLAGYYHLKANTHIHCLIAGNRFIRKINRDYLSHPYATDVIAFDLSEPGGPLEGEIIISAEMARLNRTRFHTSWKDESARYLIHAFLHLVGFSDKEKRLRRRMEREEERLLVLIKKKKLI